LSAMHFDLVIVGTGSKCMADNDTSAQR